MQETDNLADVVGYLEVLGAHGDAWARRHPWAWRIDNALGDRFAFQRWLRSTVLRRLIPHSPVPPAESWATRDVAFASLASLGGVRDVLITDGEESDATELCVAFADGAVLEILASSVNGEPALEFAYCPSESDAAKEHWANNLDD